MNPLNSLLAVLPAIESVAQNKDPNADHWLKLLVQVLQFGGFFLAGVVTHYFASQREKDKRVRTGKDSFLETVSELKATIRKDDVVGFYRETKERLKRAVFRLEIFLGKRKGKTLQVYWREYESCESQLKQQHEDDWAQGLFDATGEKHKRPSEVITNYLNKLAEFAR